MSFETEVTQALVGILSVAATTAISVGVPVLKKWAAAHTNAKTSATINNVIDGLSKIAESVVCDFNQRIVNSLKKTNPAGFTTEIQKQIKDNAVAAVKAQGSSLIALAEKEMGDIEALIPVLIEEAVVKAK